MARAVDRISRQYAAQQRAETMLAKGLRLLRDRAARLAERGFDTLDIADRARLAEVIKTLDEMEPKYVHGR